MIRLFILLAMFVECLSFGFPELTRFGNSRCMNCHISASGGGVLNSYGRQMIDEALSDNRTARGEDSTYLGFIPMSERLLIGGDIRWVADGQKPPNHWQQADLEFAAVANGAAVAASVGTQEYVNNYEPNLAGIFSRRHYLSYQNKLGWGLRAGKFQQAFGLMGIDRNPWVRSELGWGSNSETYNLEANYGGAWGEGVFSYGLGRIDKLDRNLEKGPAWRFAFAASKGMRLGISAAYRFIDDRKRITAGPYAVLSLSKKVFALVELDFDSVSVSGTHQNSDLIGFNRLVYEYRRGFHIQLQHEYQARLRGVETFYRGRYGGGIRSFLAEHLEVEAAYFYERTNAKVPSSSLSRHFFTALFHFYL